jgi:glycine cleavage system H protein
MVEISGYQFPEELHYDEHHQWAQLQGDTVVLGLTHYAQAAANDIAYVGLPRAKRQVEAGKAIGSIESGKWVGRLYAPVSGEVTAANQALEDDPLLINRDPYGEGWIVKIRATDVSQLNKLRKCTDPGFAEWFVAELEKNKPQAKG